MKQKVINAQDNNGNTPLHLAIGKGHVNVAIVLLTKGAAIDICNEQAQTVVDLANPKINPKITTECADLIKTHVARRKSEVNVALPLSPGATPVGGGKAQQQRQ